MKKNQEFATTFGKSLRVQRLALGISQSNLSKATGLTIQGIHQLEHGKRAPAFITVVQIAYGLGLTIEAFAKALEAEHDIKSII